MYVHTQMEWQTNGPHPSALPFSLGGGVGWWEPKLFFFPLKLSIKIIFQT